jgi:hypothetical protein
MHGMMQVQTEGEMPYAAVERLQAELAASQQEARKGERERRRLLTELASLRLATRQGTQSRVAARWNWDRY